MMSRLLYLALCLTLAWAAPEPQLYEEDNASLMENEARFLYFNSSSTATSLTLLGALILLGVIFYLVYVGGLLAPVSGSQYAYSKYGQDYGQYQQGSQYQARSAGGDFDFNALNILKWINMAYEVYQKFEYNDLECQKKLICEVVKDQDETFGTVSSRMQKGFEFARYLEVLNLPDDFRELLDEYLDASERAQEGTKECEEFFQCPFSIKQTVKRNLSGNSL